MVRLNDIYDRKARDVPLGVNGLSHVCTRACTRDVLAHGTFSNGECHGAGSRSGAVREETHVSRPSPQSGACNYRGKGLLYSHDARTCGTSSPVCG